MRSAAVKPLLFLGAGVSKPSGLPTVDELTDKLFVSSPADSDATRRIRALLTVIAEHDTDDIGRVGLIRTSGGLRSSGAIYRGSKTTYEDLFFLCQQISLWNIGLSDNSLVTPFMERLEQRARGLLLGSSVDERLCDLASLGREMSYFIESVVTATLRQRYVVGFDLIRELAMAPEVGQLNIVTLNHDTLVEQFLCKTGVTFVDGFGERDGDVRWSEDEVYEDESARVRLFKLHGSVDWYSFQRWGLSRRAIFTGPEIGSARDGAGCPLTAESSGPSFLSGINKSAWYDRGIYADIHFHFSQLLRQCDRILMSGYGWGDSAINFKLDTWLDRSRGNRIVLLHEHPEELVDRSLVLASGYNGWVRSGQLVCVRRWLGGTELSHVIDLLREAK